MLQSSTNILLLDWFLEVYLMCGSKVHLLTIMLYLVSSLVDILAQP
jgi:hypothetical protein